MEKPALSSLKNMIMKLSLSVSLFFYPYLFCLNWPLSLSVFDTHTHTYTHTQTHNMQSVEFPFRDYTGMLIKYAEKIKWATRPLCVSSALTHQSCCVTKGSEVAGGGVGVWGWAWVALPGGQHCYLFQSISGGCPGETVDTKCLGT